MIDVFQTVVIILAVLIVIFSKRGLQAQISRLNVSQKAALRNEFHSLRLIQYVVLFFSIIPALLITGNDPVMGLQAWGLFGTASISASAFLFYTLAFYYRHKKKGSLPDDFLLYMLKDKIILFCLILFLLTAAFIRLK